jgi:hypothetical protein
MSDDTDSNGEGFFEDFKKDLSTVDEFASLVLRGHYVLEREVDTIVGHIFFHPDGILNDRFGFTFERKVRIVRAMSRNATYHAHWDIVLAMNSLRNTIAHHGYEERQQKVDRIRALCLESTALEKHEREHGTGLAALVLFAFAICAGFLSHIEGDLESLRAEIEEIIAKHQASN